MKTDILFLNKSPYENGKISGEYFKDRISLNLENINNILQDSNVKNKIIYHFDKLKEEYPIYYDETIGKADGLGIDRLTYFAIMCPEITDINFEHCTTIICKKDNGNFIISHNEDDDYIKGNFCISKVIIDDDNWFVTNDMYNMPFGNGISWNSFGIVKTINYCHNENTNVSNYSRYYLQRHLSVAKSIEDLMSIESRLSDIRYQIDYIETQLKNYDLLVAYSTLNITITETKAYTETSENFFTRLGNSFVNGWNSFINEVGDFVIDVVYNIWVIIIVVLIIFGAYKAYKHFRNKKK